MVEKRRASRRLKRLPVRCSCGTCEFAGVTSNFSQDGLFIRTKKPFKPGVPVKLLFETDKKSTIALSGVIARAIRKEIMFSKNGMGVKLTSIPQSYSSFLEELSSNRSF